MNIFQMKSKAGLALTLAACLSVPAVSHASESRFAVSNPAYQQECGSCHVAYPPQMLSTASWRSVMGGLDKHFGTDASLDEKSRSDILRFLEQHAGKRGTNDAHGKPLLRLTETREFVHEHSEEMPRDIWKHPAIKTPANCQACHTGADKGDYSERNIRLPRGVRK